MMAGNLAVKNDIKNAPNKIVVQCSSYEHGEEIIKKIKESKAGEILHFRSNRLKQLPRQRSDYAFKFHI
jgi:hypothetical protein